MAPVARAIAMTLAAGSVLGAAHAQQRAFSPAWFSDKGAMQNSAVATGRLPNGMPASSLTSPQAQQQQASAQLQRSIDNLGLAAQAIAAQQSAQAAARLAALGSAPGVADGLTEGGLKVDSNSLTAGWLNANAPVQSVAGGQTTVAIQQTADKAILNWETFNVGRNTTVAFQQQKDWAVLNRINDPQARPSQIQGQIKADGTVLIANRNGIVFNGTSQVDTRNIVAAAASIDDNQFRARGIYGATASTPSFTGAQGKVEVQAGARITTSAPDSATQGGGYVLLLGKEVSNAGQITTRRGQTELAAGDSFVIRKGQGTDGNTASTTRGNEVAPQFVASSGAGKVENTGLIMAREGDITLAGRDVRQSGVAVASTTVNARGTIHLLDSAADTMGKVTLGNGATTAIVIEDDGKTTALDSQRDALVKDSLAQDLLRNTTGAFDNLSLLSDRRDQSRVEIVSGGDVLFDTHSLTLATGGQIAVSAKNRSFVADRAQIDVSGAVGVSLAMESNNVKVNVQGNEQRDAPANRDSRNLLNANVGIDRRKLVYVPAGTGGYAGDRWYTAGGLLEVGGYLGNQGHGIGEWAAQGGTVVLGGKEVVTQAGSGINLSGGSLNVQTGYLNQTWLKGSDGRLYNVNQAPAHVVFTGVYKGFEDEHKRWGDNTTGYYYNPLIGPQRLLENGYTVGRDAGRLIVNAPTAVLEGDIVAKVFDGAQQNQARAAQDDGYKQSQAVVARAGGLLLGQYTGAGRMNGFASDVKIDDVAAITPGMGAADALDAQRLNTVWLDASQLNRQKLGVLDLASAGQIIVNKPLALDDGGSLGLSAPVVNVNADLTARAGSVSVSNILKQGNGGTLALTTAQGLAQLTLAGGATVDARGLWTNLRTDPNERTGLAFLNGGNVSFDSIQNLTLVDGSAIDVSSGGAVLANGKTQGGRGGNVTLVAGDAIGNATNASATIVLGSAIRGYGVNGGGTLTLSSPGTVLIGDATGLTGGTLPANTPTSATFVLSQPLTVAAGQALPMQYSVAVTQTPLDLPLPAGVGPGDLRTSTSQGVIAQKDWVVPAGMRASNYLPGGTSYQAGDTVPAGTNISWLEGTFPAGYVLRSDTFPSGIKTPLFTFTLVAGTVVPTAVTFAVGALIPKGTTLGQPVAIQAPPFLSQRFFASGFSSYDLTAGAEVRVMDGMALAPVMPVYRFSGASLFAPSGSDPASAMSVWLPPLFTENAQTSTLTQRGGASLALRSLVKGANGLVAGGGSVVIGDGASVSVDPGQAIKLDAFGQVTVNGSLTARGGSIALVNEADVNVDVSRNFDAAGTVKGVSLWLGENAKLDVSGAAYRASDIAGHDYGVATDGGSIGLNGGGAFVVVRPGAELNADGANAHATAFSNGQALVGNGGAIALSSLSGLYLDGNMHAAAGGDGAAGGNLSVSLLTPAYNDPLGKMPKNVLVPSTLLVTQALQPSLLPAGTTPDASAPLLALGQARVSADMVKAGGFGNLSLISGDYVQFSGDVSLSLAQSLTLTGAAFTSGPALAAQPPASAPSATGNVRLSAPYVLLREPLVVIPDGSNSGSVRNPGAATSPTVATFEVNANQIDVQGPIVFSASAFDGRSATFSPGFSSTRLVSQGDIRFLPSTAQGGTQLATSWDLDLLASQVYPATNAVAVVTAGQSNPDHGGTLTIGRTTGVVPDAPLSVFGSLTLAAPIVAQGGIVRAPFGSILLGSHYPATQKVELLPGSITSVSTDGVVVPYGGTVDGVTYAYNGATVTPKSLTNFTTNSVQSGITLDARSIDVQQGATLDLSGGGALTGAGFVSGRGGSVNVLNTALVNANPATTISKAGNKVYAIVPGYASGYAPVSPENGAGDPAIGQQITITAGVPGLAAGIYTLLPSNYALLPGAYRIELGAASQRPIGGTVSIGNGTYVTSAYTGVANTGIRSTLPATALITSGTAVRKYAQYNEQGYSDFLAANAARFGGLRPLLPADGKALVLSFEPLATTTLPTPTMGSALRFSGTALFQGAGDGFAGQVATTGLGEVYAGAPTPGFSGTSVRAADLDALGAPRLMFNGVNFFNNGALAFVGGGSYGGDLFIRDGVTLRAGELFLIGNNVSVGKNVTLSTVGRGAAPFDSTSTGMGYVALGGASVLALSNGNLEFLGTGGNPSSGAVNVGAGSRLYSEGTLAFVTSGSSSLDSSAHFGSRSIVLAVGTMNIGSAADVAAGGAPAGLLFNQSLFDVLVNGDPEHGAPPLERITLSAGNSVNVFGSAGLDASGAGIAMVLNTPAIYGYGAAGDRAKIAADKIVWNGIAGATPPAIAPGGAGTGAGSLELVANEIDFGKFISLDPSSVNRVIYGFGNVEMVANSRMVSAGSGSLDVYQAPGTSAGDVFGRSGTGGNLTLSTPLLTGQQKSVMAYTAGGALRVNTPGGMTPSTASSTVGGAEIDLAGDSVAIASTILLPSGKLVVNAVHDIDLAAGSRIDLAGRPSTIQKATVYGFGGTLQLNSAQGSVVQSGDSMIDVSATKATAGSIAVGAGNGRVAFDGTLTGGATDGQASGEFSVTAGTLADFAGLNARLTQGGFFETRGFDIKAGDLSIGDEVKAHNVNISVDGGSLAVHGRVDASGAAPGTIRLSAGNGLVLAPGANLDAHGTVLQVDSYGQPIEARNRGHIELTAAGGRLTLAPGAAMNLSTPNGIAYGDVVLNAQRTGETSGDIAIDASGPLTIKGARSIALNAFWTYALPGGSTITQGTLDSYDTASTAFIDAALGNPGLASRVAGLSAYGSAYHLRPGVQITSIGDLSTLGDIDLSKYRYGTNADRDPNSTSYGAGEPVDLVIRAGGNLSIKGSISDGFRTSAETPATYRDIEITDGTLFQGGPALCGPYACWAQSSTNVVLLTAWTIPNDDYFNNWQGGLQGVDGHLYVPGDTVPAGTELDHTYWIGFDGPVLPRIAIVATPAVPGAAPTSARAQMLGAGLLSASVRLVAGADLAAADQRALLPRRALNGRGNLTLTDPQYAAEAPTFFSVLRTGTGSLDLLAGGNFSEATPFGVYTAGTQSAPLLAADGSNPYDLQGASGGSTHAWYPEHGGDVLVSAQGDVTGRIGMGNNNTRFVDSNQTSNWLWRQGGGGLAADPAAWWINFGAYAKTSSWMEDSSLIGFQGIGTLGGGNLTVVAGGNAGATGSSSTGLDLAVASTGRVLADGTLVQTGGGDLTLKVGGQLNSVSPSQAQNFGPNYFGSLTDLRGNMTISAGAIGMTAQNLRGATWTSLDPRTLDPATIKRSLKSPGPAVSPGDGIVTVTTRGDLVFGGAIDAGMADLAEQGGMRYTRRDPDGSTTAYAGGQGGFTLWTPTTAIRLYAAGGDVAPMNRSGYYPGTLTVVAANGDIRFADPAETSFSRLELTPSPVGQLDLLAAGSIYGSSQTVAMSGASMSSLATPFHPVFVAGAKDDGRSNASPTSAYAGDSIYNPVAFGPDTSLGNLHAGDGAPARVYAGVDIDDLTLGQVRVMVPSPGFTPTPLTWYLAAKPFEVIAGRDIVGTGTVSSVFLNNQDTDISVVRAGRDIFYQSIAIAGPGLLDVQAGRNLYQGQMGSLESVGPLFGVNAANRSGGAGISVLVGGGAAGADYADFARLYFNAANALPTGTALAGSGKVARTYERELLAWLQQRFGYAGSTADALAYFLSLPGEQQGVFVREVYFAELTAGGREYNDAANVRHGSYLRGRDAIATLFPDRDAQGRPIRYAGSITMFSGLVGYNAGKPVMGDGGIRTDFGGDIQLLAPGGQVIVGTEGVTPGAGSGLITQGSGNISVYSKGSLLLGLSRIMTTFGGGILGWSAEGDINAGRGAKTTLVYTPPRRVYDDAGNVTLSPNVPSSGAGIATLNPIPEVPPGDVDLIAPLGTIDAGEAGIRVSGSVNLAALQVVNAANIQVQGKSTGLPTIAAVNVGALTSASAAASQATAAAQDAVQRERAAARGSLASVFTVRVLGFGNEPSDGDKVPPPPSSPGAQSGGGAYDPASAVQLIGVGNDFDPGQLARLSDAQRQRLRRDR